MIILQGRASGAALLCDGLLLFSEFRRTFSRLLFEHTVKIGDVGKSAPVADFFHGKITLPQKPLRMVQADILKIPPDRGPGFLFVKGKQIAAGIPDLFGDLIDIQGVGIMVFQIGVDEMDDFLFPFSGV